LIPPPPPVFIWPGSLLFFSARNDSPFWWDETQSFFPPLPPRYLIQSPLSPPGKLNDIHSFPTFSSFPEPGAGKCRFSLLLFFSRLMNLHGSSFLLDIEIDFLSFSEDSNNLSWRLFEEWVFRALPPFLFVSSRQQVETSSHRSFLALPLQTAGFHV